MLYEVITGDVSTATYARLLDIPWIDADQFLKVEISTHNDGNYAMVSNQKFVITSYSIHYTKLYESVKSTNPAP